MEKLLSKILEKIKKDSYLFQTWEDLLYMCKETMKEDIPLGVRYLKLLSVECERAISNPLSSEQEVKELYALHKRVLLAAAPYDFDSYLLYVEWNREPSKKFYPPRRKVLKQVVDSLQELADDKLDLLAVSLPPGSGKTTLAIFYLTWLGGKIPNEPMLTGSHSNSFVRGVSMINWKVRIKNKTFWLTIIPAVLLLVQVVAAVFGYTLDLGDLGDRLLDVVNAVFTVLVILGVVNDPTTAGVTDSTQALTYTEPKKKK